MSDSEKEPSSLDKAPDLDVREFVFPIDEKSALMRENKILRERIKTISKFARHAADCMEWTKIDTCSCGLLGALRG